MTLVLAIVAALIRSDVLFGLHTVADTSISAHPDEDDLNFGASTRLRLKGNEHVLLLDFGRSWLYGRRVLEARLVLRPAAPHRLKVLGISTVAEPWEEGVGRGEVDAHGATFRRRGYGEWRAGDLLGSTFGRNGTDWVAVEIQEGADGSISAEIPPSFVEAIGAGKSHGLAVSDEKGQTRWNNDVFSREEPDAGPLLIVRAKSPRPTVVPVETPHRTTWLDDLLRGILGGPSDVGVVLRPSDLSGFDTPLGPTPSVARGGPLPLGEQCAFTFLAEGSQPDPFGSLPVDDAFEGWDGRTLLLRAARGEHVGVTLAVGWSGGPEPRVRLTLRGPEGTTHGAFARPFIPGDAGPVADPLIPMTGAPLNLASLSGQRVGLAHLEWFVPASLDPGERRGSLLVETGASRAEVPVSLVVERVVLPDRPTFVLSLNTYGFPATDPAGERAWFRLAHEHRAALAVVPYSQSGRLAAGAAPEIDRVRTGVRVRSWRGWDERFGPLFDGSAFRGLPRDGVPIDHFLLPLHENWPLPIDEHYAYRGSLADHWRDAAPIESALPEEYATALEETTAAFARHVDERGWTATRFFAFLNNKVDFRARGRGTSWWLLDEPAHRDDFLALRWFGQRFRSGVESARSRGRVQFRVDLSRPEWRREHLDGVVDLVVCNALRTSDRIAFQTRERTGEALWSYGEPSLDARAVRETCLLAWLDGADGMVPWQSVGSERCWSRVEATALLYPPQGPGIAGPLPSIRLKMLRRAAQDAELLTLLAGRLGREQVADGFRRFLTLRTASETGACECIRIMALDRLAE